MYTHRPLMIMRWKSQLLYCMIRRYLYTITNCEPIGDSANLKSRAWRCITTVHGSLASCWGGIKNIKLKTIVAGDLM